MRTIIQRVNRASVTVENQLISAIEKGVLCLVGIGTDDTKEDLEYTARKICNLRLWDHQDKKWSASVKIKQYEILLVSQFTLYAKILGNKLDFHNALNPEAANAMFQDFAAMVKAEYQKELQQDMSEKIKLGMFGEYMQVDLQNDGPVTITIDSKQRK